MRNRRRKEVEAKKRVKRSVFFTLGVLIIIYLFITLIFGENGLLKYIKLEAVKEDVQAEIKGLEKQNEETKKQIEAGREDPNLIEELARKQGLTREDELIFKFKDGQ
ncbi:MAG TPA: hypothetical protein ENG95_02660 [Nitrospirae bacterium]|nr:cell division protein FtsB [bacterium BMS3Abin10]GBE38206.1 cell division protein FtsB [bacterium BMS3Bbin08]HDH50129.1 hypothetical protein [Nitrospirota bacterium]HDO25533.1 hypothetical protein [Nitrospirota bacterium]